MCLVAVTDLIEDDDGRNLGPHLVQLSCKSIMIEEYSGQAKAYIFVAGEEIIVLPCLLSNKRMEPLILAEFRKESCHSTHNVRVISAGSINITLSELTTGNELSKINAELLL